MSSLDIYFRPHLKLNTLYQTILNSLLKQYVIYRAARDPENKIIDFEIIYENIPDIESFPKVSDKLKYILKKSLSKPNIGKWSATDEGIVFALSQDDVLLVRHNGRLHAPDEIKMKLLLGDEAAGEVVDQVVLNRAIRQSVHDLSQDGKPFALGLINIDDFQELEGLYGKEVGESILDVFSTQLEEQLGASDQLLEMDGNGFAVLLKDERNLSDLISLFEELSQSVGRGMEIDGHDINVEFSAGYVLVAKPEVSITEVMTLAESLMYRIKSFGKNGYMSMAINERSEGANNIAIDDDQ